MRITPHLVYADIKVCCICSANLVRDLSMLHKENVLCYNTTSLRFVASELRVYMWTGHLYPSQVQSVGCTQNAKYLLCTAYMHVICVYARNMLILRIKGELQYRALKGSEFSR